MNGALLPELGKYAGIGGVALGVFFLIFKNLIGSSVLGSLPERQRFIVLIIVLVLPWTVALAGIGAWLLRPTPVGTEAVAAQRSDRQAGCENDLAILTEPRGFLGSGGKSYTNRRQLEETLVALDLGYAADLNRLRGDLLRLVRTGAGHDDPNWDLLYTADMKSLEASLKRKLRSCANLG